MVSVARSWATGSFSPQPLSLLEKKLWSSDFPKPREALDVLYLKLLEILKHCHKKSCSEMLLLLRLLLNKMQMVSTSSLSTEIGKLLFTLIKLQSHQMDLAEIL